jgi:O-antigen/teichoic acid export membrane protein
MSGVLAGAARNLLAGTITKYVFLLVTIVTGIFLMPFTMHHLGKAEYGLWMLAASMTAYFQLLDLGYGSGLVRQITQADARGDEHQINTVLSTFLVVYGGIGLIALFGVAALVLIVVPRFPNLAPEQIPTAQWVLSILGFRAAVGFPMTVFGAVTTARQRFALTGSIGIAVSLLQAAATYLVLSAGYGLVPLVATTASIAIASYIAYAAAARATFPALHLTPRWFDWRQVREVTSFSLYLFLITIAIQVGLNVDALVIGAFMGTSAVAVYMVAMKIGQYLWQLCGQASSLMFPVMVRFHADRNEAALRTTLVEGTRLAVALVMGLTICLLLYGPAIIDLWMGPGFEASAAPLYVLAVFGVAVVAQGPTGNMLLGAGRHRLVAWVSIADVALNLAISVFLVSRIGLVGAALGTAIPYIILNFGVLVPAACRLVRVPLGTFARIVLGPALAGVGGALVVALPLRLANIPPGLGMIAGQVLLVSTAYLLAFWFAGLERKERERYRGALWQVSAGLLQPRVAA